MRRLLTLFLCFIIITSYGQTTKKLSTYLQFNYSHTLYDLTEENNPWGIGIGLQSFLNLHSRFKPTLEVTGDVYLENDKVFRMYPGGQEKEDIPATVNVFAGTSYDLMQNVYVSFVAGPCFINNKIYLGIKPSLGFYFSSSHRWSGKISYINIFDRDPYSNEDFGSLNLAIGLKLF